VVMWKWGDVLLPSSAAEPHRATTASTAAARGGRYGAGAGHDAASTPWSQRLGCLVDAFDAPRIVAEALDAVVLPLVSGGGGGQTMRSAGLLHGPN
jgi:hypothetical protein